MVTIEGNPWFVAGDVCRALGAYVSGGKVNVTLATQTLDPHERGFNPIKDPTGFSQRTCVISESGLYKLLMRSDKPLAKPFQDWVSQVVLPAIRKDGGYVMGEEKVGRGAGEWALAID